MAFRKFIYNSIQLISILSIFYNTNLKSNEIDNKISINGTEQNCLFNQESQTAFHHLLGSLNHTNDKETQSFYHIVASVDSDQGKVTLKDDSEWDIGWWYKSDIRDWKEGDRLEVMYHRYTVFTNSIELRNIDRRSTAWGELNMAPSKSKRDFIARILSSQQEEHPYHKAVLDSGWLVEAPNHLKQYGIFSQWAVKDEIFVFHSEGKYDLWNLTNGQILHDCTFLKNEKSHNELENNTISPSVVLKLESKLNKRVLDQPEASKAVTTALINYSAGLNDPNTPIGAFLFIGPTGVGKTELAKALAAELYGSQEALIRFDMSHFVSSHTVERLIGAPPGYVNHEEGGQLTEALKNKPQSIVLLDEIEKAHDSVRKIFLPVFDDGHLKDAKDIQVDCKNAIFIMTSNICSQEAIKLFDAGYEADEVLEAIEPKIMQTLSPELYNRVQPVLFRPLTEDVMERLVTLMLEGLSQRLKETKGIDLYLDDSVYQYLIENGFHPTLGARPLKKLVEKKVTATIAYALIVDSIPDGSQVELFYDRYEDEWVVSWVQ